MERITRRQPTVEFSDGTILNTDSIKKDEFKTRLPGDYVIMSRDYRTFEEFGIDYQLVSSHNMYVYVFDSEDDLIYARMVW